MKNSVNMIAMCLAFLCIFSSVATCVAQTNGNAQTANPKSKQDAKHLKIESNVTDDPKYATFGIYEQTAPRPNSAEPVSVRLPIDLKKGTRIALIGNTLLDRSIHFAHLESLIYQRYPAKEIVIRNLAWSGDSVDLRPRPENFADLFQHLHHEKIDLIIAAFGFNESFAGKEGLSSFRNNLTQFVDQLRTKSFNGKTASQIVLLSPTANEDLPAIPAASMNNANLRLYTEVMREVAEEQRIGFIDVYHQTEALMTTGAMPYTINGVHLNVDGYAAFANLVYRGLFQETPPSIDESIRQLAIDKNRQYLRRYRPLNTFYYTGGRRKDYGYLDFLPAMQSFDLLVENRERAIWNTSTGESSNIDDSNVPPLPDSKTSRGANQWLSAEDELKAFKIDPRFEVNLFAGEEQFPELACPIQIRWDSKGRLWVACSTTYPHVYPGNEPNDKIVILEDTDLDGRADQSTVFADDLHIPLSFEFGNGGVYVSEMPDLTFLKDTDGDDKADVRERILTGFGTEDSHHALHDFVWTPDGDLLFRESIFHHSQVETPYGPIRQQNSGWFRFDTQTQRLTSFGTYRSTNPWGVTFDDWGQHVASHPIYAAAFHSLDPPYPLQHATPRGLQAYSGTCGQEFVDFATFPKSMQGDFIKVRYKPTNRVEIHHWNENAFGFKEEYVGDLIFSTNLSFIPVDIGYGPRGALYICDWYNPIKGHAQYSLRDDRRDRHSGRIWRITTKDTPLQDPPKIHDASIEELLSLLKRPEYRIRYWAKRELRERNHEAVATALQKWISDLSSDDTRFRHHQLEAVWILRGIKAPNLELIRELLTCEDHHARAAATRQLRFLHSEMPDAIDLLRVAANDAFGIVRMEAAIASTYIGSKEALDAMLDVMKYPREEHLQYAIECALGSAALRKHWENDPNYQIESILKQAKSDSGLMEPRPTPKEIQFDQQKELKTIAISCVPERMRFTIEQFAVKAGQPLKVIFTNPDATDHNLLFIKPDSLSQVGMAANEMARDPKNANSDFIPAEQQNLILQATPMIGPTRQAKVHVLRFNAPTKPGIYPYLCTFPGHWVVMRGEMVVTDELNDVRSLLAKAAPKVIKHWKMQDFATLKTKQDEKTIMDGMQAFVKAGCNQCHQLAGHGVNLGPDLTTVGKRLSGKKLLQQILEPSAEIHKDYRSWKILTADGQAINGIIQKETKETIELVTNLLLPNAVSIIPKSEIDLKIESNISSMPVGLVDVLTEDEILSLVGFLESDGFKLPLHLLDQHGHSHTTK